MYDKREGYQIAEKSLEFTFKPSRYETWASGELIDKGSTSAKIQCIPVFFDESKSEIKTFSLSDNLNLRDTLIFDMTFTSGDRIYIATVPQETNIEDYNSFQSFKTNVPFNFPIITREKRDFDINEPYVCSVFTQNNVIVKISFSFGNRPRLLEFYS